MQSTKADILIYFEHHPYSYSYCPFNGLCDEMCCNLGYNFYGLKKDEGSEQHEEKERGAEASCGGISSSEGRKTGEEDE